MTEVTAVVAATLSNGIGKNGGLPWRLPGEMKYFQRVTLGSGSLSDTQQEPANTVIMGRKTWESIPNKFRPLAGRRNAVVSRQGVDLGDAKNSTSHTSLESAIASSSSSSSSSSNNTSRTYLIGGAQLYNLSLTSSPSLINRLLLTRVQSADGSDIECDTYLEDFTSHLKPSPDGSTATDKAWRLASHAELEEYVGFEVQQGEVEEKGFKYRFELWVRT